MTTSDAGVLQQDITVKRGDRIRRFRFTVKDNAGALVDVTGLAAKLAVNPNPDPENTDDQLFEIAGEPASPTSLGYFDFALGPSDALQTPDTYFYDVQITDGSSKKQTLAEGKWIVQADIADAGT